jgi:hypothetical protein
MVRLEDIPKYAICRNCGQPYQVVDLGPLAARLGVKIPDGSFVFRCCGSAELTIEDEVAELKLRELLIAYHSQEKTPP